MLLCLARFAVVSLRALSDTLAPREGDASPARVSGACPPGFSPQARNSTCESVESVREWADVHTRRPTPGQGRAPPGRHPRGRRAPLRPPRVRGHPPRGRGRGGGREAGRALLPLPRQAGPLRRRDRGRLRLACRPPGRGVLGVEL